MDKRLLALLAALGATTIYGLNHTIMKVIMPDFIQPNGLVLLRVIVGTFLFWGVSLFLPKERIEKKRLRTDFLGSGFWYVHQYGFFHQRVKSVDTHQ